MRDHAPYGSLFRGTSVRSTEMAKKVSPGKVFNKDLFEVFNKDRFYGTALWDVPQTCPLVERSRESR